MSDLKTFLELVRTDPAITATLAGANGQQAYAEAAVAMGRDRGLAFTVEEVVAALQTQGAELSDAALESVSGGVMSAGADGPSLRTFIPPFKTGMPSPQ
jgi:predicted ribosomally synthesized peptide with nif11-like leader